MGISVQLKLEKMVSSVVSKPKTSATHPGFTRMITEAITALQSRNGSSRMAILKYITENYKVESAKPVVNVRLSLKRMVDQNLLKMGRESGKGAGCYKLVKVVKKRSEDSETKKVSSKSKTGKRETKTQKSTGSKPKTKKVTAKSNSKKDTKAKPSVDKVKKTSSKKMATPKKQKGKLSTKKVASISKKPATKKTISAKGSVKKVAPKVLTKKKTPQKKTKTPVKKNNGKKK